MIDGPGLLGAMPATGRRSNCNLPIMTSAYGTKATRARQSPLISSPSSFNFALTRLERTSWITASIASRTSRP